MTNEKMAVVFSRNFRRLMNQYFQDHAESFKREKGTKLTRESFAWYILDIQPRTLGYYLSGKRIPTWETLHKITEIFGTTSDGLLCE